MCRGLVHGLLSRLRCGLLEQSTGDRKSTRLNSSHANISYAVFCLKTNNADPERERRLYKGIRQPLEDYPANHPVVRTLRTAESGLFGAVPPDVMDALPHDEAHRDA